MVKSIQEILATNPYINLSPKEALASYEHIELTEEERDLAILAAKQKKERAMEDAEREKIIEANRKLLQFKRWPYEACRIYMLQRADPLFKGKFKVDGSNEALFNLLCYYFSEDELFVQKAEAMGIANPSLYKGIFLAGNCGIGKTWLLQLFKKNQRQTYYVRSAKEIANGFQTAGEESLDQYVKLFENPVNDPETFYQKYSGLCIDDIGTEDLKNHYGNRKNVVGDLIETRYFEKLMGPYLHATTNLTSAQLKEYYGERVISRLRETVNWIEVSGTDRRR